jgi:hypothetical protein
VPGRPRVSWARLEGTAANDPQGGVETAHGAAGIRVLVSFAVGIAAFGVVWLATP